jgi:hypothetical protein
MALELAWKNPNPPQPTERRIVKQAPFSGLSTQRRYLAYWGLSIFFNVRCVVFELIEGKTHAA